MCVCVWERGEGGLSIIDGKWQMTGFGETGEGVDRGGRAGDSVAVQGHGWNETWAACRWAVESKKEREREKARGGGKRDSFLVRTGRGGGVL